MGAATHSPVGGGGSVNAFHTYAIAHRVGAVVHSSIAGEINAFHENTIVHIGRC